MMKKFSYLPKAKSGKLSVALIILFFILFAVMQILVASGQRGGETFSDNLFLSIPALLMAASGISAFFTGAFAIIKKKERAALVFIATLFGFLILIFVAGEFLFPH